jgi:tRNA/tmRNA/rRNA uracil-C5-methylase (TrmA/RlmC/RlmD family)
VARHEGRVIFVRHALPGERARVRITEGGAGSRFLRGDAVEILHASAERLPVACPVAGPGGCGGCDWQHASLDEQRRLKAAVVREQLQRLAHLEVDVVVEALPGAEDGLGWRTRVQLGADAQGRLGYRRHRSHELVAVDSCPITHPEAAQAGHLQVRWPGGTQVEVVGSESSHERLIVVTPPEGASRAALPDVDASVAVASDDSGGGLTRVRGRTWVREAVTVGGWSREFRVTGAGFWQVHPAAAETFVAAVLRQLRPRPGERALDLYSGVGLFTAALASVVGPDGAVVGVEGDPRAVADARRNLHDLPWVELHRGAVGRELATAIAALPESGVDIVVLDPPRAGAGADVISALCAAAPRAISYVACDPSSLARDVQVAAEHGYRLAALRAFDAFPMTHHVECVALLTPAPSSV